MNNILQKDFKKVSTLKELQTNFDKTWDGYMVKNGFYVENGEKKKAPGWKIFKRFEWFWEQRVNLETGEFPQTNSAFEYEEVKNNLKKSNSFSESWSNLGTSSSSGGYAGIGRINCIAFHPSDVNTFWVGSPSGGIWRTTDGGLNWTILNNNELVLGVSGIAITSDYTTSQTLYIATGDRDGGSIWSLNGGQASDNVTVGVYKSTDGGATWSATGLVLNKSTGARITSLLIHPSNNSILFASVWTGNSATSGIYKSVDGGTNWSMKTNNLWMDIEFKPGDPTVMYASSYGYSTTYINRSTDSGENWSIALITSNGRRGELAVSSANPTIVYLLTANSSGGVEGIYKSTDSGVSFSKVNNNSVTEPGMCGYFTDGSGGSGGQGSYDLCIAADPSDAGIVYIGGITTWKSTDGGVSWTALTNWTSSPTYNKSSIPVVHADKHALTFNGSTLFEGNDGGVYKTTDGGTNWTDLTNGMVISQLYRIGVAQTSATTVITGLQDNGSKLYSSGSWDDVKGGDGMECIVDYSNSNYMYASYVNGQITRSINGFTNWITEEDISANIPGGQPTGAWVTPYIIDPNSSTTLFAGYDQVWKTTDRGNNWTSVSQVLSSTDKLRSLAIAPSNSNVLYTADRLNMWKTTDGGATNWSAITLPTLNNSITYITVHPTDANTLWFTVGGYTSGQKVYESTDGGGTWTEISAGLPNLPVMCIVHYKEATDRNVLFVGTDLGVYVKDGINNWASYNTGLPNVVVTELEIYYNPSGTDKLRAGTYGRGLWETDIDAALPVELKTFNFSINNNIVSLNWETASEVNNYGFEIEKKTIASDTESLWRKIGFVEGFGNSNSPKFYEFNDQISEGGNKFEYRLKQIDINGQFEYSDKIEVEITPNEYLLTQNYPNPFNPTTNITFNLPQKSEVSIKVFNMLGKEIKELVNEVKDVGIYSVEFNANNLPSGVYYYSLKTNNYTQTKKMLLVK